MAERRPLVLILCTGNSCRSQMAEAFLRKYQGDKYEVHSAGLEPAPEVHPMAVQVMSEAGIDIAGQRPKSVDLYLGHRPVRHILIVCDRANMSCPRIWPGAATRSYLPFDDPAAATGSPAQRIETFRRVRDGLADAMRSWSPGLNAPQSQESIA